MKNYSKFASLVMVVACSKMPKFTIMIRLLIAIFFITSNTFAQIEISGRVTDLNDEPLTGVNVFVAGKVLSSMTNSSGEFHITIPDSAENQTENAS